MQQTDKDTQCHGATLGEILSILGVVSMLFLLGAAGCSFLLKGSALPENEKPAASTVGDQ